MSSVTQPGRQQLSEVIRDIKGWNQQVHSILDVRSAVLTSADRALAEFRSRVVDVRIHDTIAWRVLPLLSSDTQLLGALARQQGLPPLSGGTEFLFAGLLHDAERALQDARASHGVRRLFSSNDARNRAGAAVDFLLQYREWAWTAGVPQQLDLLVAQHSADSGRIPIDQALSDSVGLRSRLADLGSDPYLLSGKTLEQLQQALTTINEAGAREEVAKRAAEAMADRVRRQEVEAVLSEMPLERLKDVARERLRVAPLTDAGIRTIQDLLVRERQLPALPGMGSVTTTRVLGAARRIRQTTYEEMPVRIDVRHRDQATTELLRRLAEWDALSRAHQRLDVGSIETARALFASLDPRARCAVLLSVTAGGAQFPEAIQSLLAAGAALSAAESPDPQTDPWDDFLRRPADYFALLDQLGFLTERDERAHGDLPDNIVEAVRRFRLDTKNLNVSLRGYQHFGACFALTQRRVILGDEMGLGKTIEALAVASHLSARGKRHFLVICPATVMTNWLRETSEKSRLTPYRLHGPQRDSELRTWLRSGGVAITNFESLNWLEPQLTQLLEIGCVIVDEAHYIKNPQALRSRQTLKILMRTEYAVLLTGTPLENRPAEFRQLVSYVQPDLRIDAQDFSPRRFRRQVAPAYLRRNQNDVLVEMPELVEVNEWVAMSAQDLEAYVAAVRDGNFMAMRQAAMIRGLKYSRKLARLLELIDEAAANGRRVLVFSFFRRVLDEVAHALPADRVFGPLNGSVPLALRQRTIDEFTSSAPGSALVSQISVGGVGLNLQAASVIILCEPQLKPSTEWQAIARAHRMGQLEAVQVHRLLSENAVDQRIIEMLAKKATIFDEFARVSNIAEAAPEALDISESQLAREIINAERERLLRESYSEPSDSQEDAV